MFLPVYQMATVPDFADCSWFLPLVKQANASEHVRSSRALTERHKTCLADRYFTTRYLPDLCGVKGNDLCVMQHSNKICVIGLAAGHNIFSQCSPLPCPEKKVKIDNDCRPEQQTTEDEVKKEEHTLLGIDFQVS